MLQKYSTIAHAIILFLFGLTLMTVSPVFAEDSPEFVACQQIKPAGDFNLMKQKKNCFRDLAREFGAKESARAEWKACKQIRPKGDLDLLEEKKNCFTDLASSLR